MFEKVASSLAILVASKTIFLNLMSCSHETLTILQTKVINFLKRAREFFSQYKSSLFAY
jgi:hypothetical protein